MTPIRLQPKSNSFINNIGRVVYDENQRVDNFPNTAKHQPSTTQDIARHQVITDQSNRKKASSASASLVYLFCLLLGYSLFFSSDPHQRLPQFLRGLCHDVHRMSENTELASSQSQRMVPQSITQFWRGLEPSTPKSHSAYQAHQAYCSSGTDAILRIGSYCIMLL